MSTDPSPELNSLFQTALREFESRAGTNLVQHQVFNRLRTCQSVDSVLDVLHEQTQAFRNFRGNDGKLMMWIKRIVHVLHSLSTSGVLGEGVGLAFPPAKAVFAGIAVLLSAIKDIDNTYDALVDLFESFESFLKRLDIYTKIPSTAAITEIIIKILIELLNTISLAIQQLKQGRLKKLGKKLLGENDVELVLQRLDRLTLEESRMIGTQTLEVVYGLVKNMKIVMDNGSVLMNDIHHALGDELQKNVREWLCPPDPSINHNTARQAHHEGSAEWFIHENNTFAQWKSSTGSLLWIYGKPGSGKTILSSSIIEEITRICKAGLATTAFFYFDFKNETKKNSRGALSSLLLQLAAQSDVYSKNLSALYSEHHVGSKQPSEYALKECFKKMLTVSGQGPIYIVIDALDECPVSVGTPSPRENVLSLVEWLLKLHCPRLSVCVTSRPEADIMAILQPLASHSISLHGENGQNEDITNYIRWFVNSDSKARKWKREDKEYVIEKLSERADGILRRCPPPLIRQALDELPATLDETYERTLLDINEDNQGYAHRLFQCLVVSFRPLRVEELAELLAFKFEEGRAPIFRRDCRSEEPRDAVLSTCSSLIAVVDVDGSAIVQFSHFSVKEYLTSARIAEGQVLQYHIPLEPAHTLITQACLSILLQLDDRMTKEQIKDFPLAGYAARYWVEHAKVNNVLSQTEDMAKRLFDPRGSHFSAWLARDDPRVAEWYLEAAEEEEEEEDEEDWEDAEDWGDEVDRDDGDDEEDEVV
ncbi:hypothetical protein BC827DRAFT_1157101 [Russula dissimulans]|nr:hypothetical protein BC827DRAFT_1157101 [Russula dissimulans]